MKRLRGHDLDALAAEYHRAAVLNGRAVVRGDERTASRTEALLDAVARELRRRGAAADALGPLLDDADPSVRVWSAAHLLADRDEATSARGRAALEVLAAGDHALAAQSATGILAGHAPG